MRETLMRCIVCGALTSCIVYNILFLCMWVWLCVCVYAYFFADFFHLIFVPVVLVFFILILLSFVASFMCWIRVILYRLYKLAGTVNTHIHIDVNAALFSDLIFLQVLLLRLTM